MPEPSQFERATRFRNNAAACGMFAANAVSLLDRERLLRMQRTWLKRAPHEDFVNGCLRDLRQAPKHWPCRGTDAPAA